jgi:hypothetical protein
MRNSRSAKPTAHNRARSTRTHLLAKLWERCGSIARTAAGSTSTTPSDSPATPAASTAPPISPGLRIREKDWRDSLASLTVGPGAYVQCYDANNFDESIFWLLPNQVVEAVDELTLAERIDSIRLYDRPPFAHEAGYAAYMLWAASHLAKMKE